MRGFNRITEGLTKALGYMSGAFKPPGAEDKKVKPKWEFKADAPAIHKVRGPGGAIIERRVPVMRATRIDYSRYTAADLRAIRARGGGAKEQARAARRAAKTTITIGEAA